MKTFALILAMFLFGSCGDSVEPLTLDLKLEIQFASHLKAHNLGAGDKVLLVDANAASPELAALSAKFGAQCQVSTKAAKDINWSELIGGSDYKMIFCIGVPVIGEDEELPETQIPLVISVTDFKSPVPQLLEKGWISTALAPLPLLGDKPAVDRELMITSQLQATSVVMIRGQITGLRERFPQLF